MPSFARSFEVDDLAKWDADHPGNAVRTLFEHWCLPGEAPAGTRLLRLGLRNGYLNFYMKGQSVAKLSCRRGRPKLSVHRAYVIGRRRDKAGNSTPPAEGYQDFDAEALASPATGALIADWIETAETYASAEKRFVDDLIAANPGVIDLEMALPAGGLPDSKQVAPRMDLVVAQRVGGEAPSICFWEAKCANNSELRASEDGEPKVVEQVGKYVRWMGEGERVAQVQQAYRITARKLLDLHRLFHGTDGAGAESVQIWQQLVEVAAPAVAVQPGIVIGNYWPKGYTEQIASGRMAQYAASFARKGHGDKLQLAGLRVHEVGPGYSEPALPVLPAANGPEVG